MRRYLNLIVLCILFIAVTPFASAQEAGAVFPITVTDATGNPVTIESLDAIVSGSGDVTEIIYALGFYDHLVGVDATSTYPAEALQDKTEVGFSRRLTVEPIAALNPTVFFCTQICGPPDVIEQVRMLGIPVVIVPDSENGGLNLPFPKIETVAAALGVPEKGAALAEQVRLEIEWSQTAIANVATKPSVLNFYVRGRGLQLAFGDNTPTDAVIEGAGGINAAAAVGVDGYQPLSSEILLTAYPDYLLLMEGAVDSSGGLEKVLQIQGVMATPAAQNGNIIVMDTEFMLGMTIRTGQAVLDLAAQIHDDMTWELNVAYPYTVTDASDTDVTVTGATTVYATTDALLDLTQRLGFHSQLLTQPTDGSLIIATPADDVQTWRDAGFTVVMVDDDTAVNAVATALGVPGRGEALLARLAQAS